MKTRRILILGYFGRTTNKRDGQTIKTRQYLELLEKNLGGSARIDTFDTQVLHFRPWQVITLLWKVVRSKTVVYMPAQNNLSHFFGTLFVLSRIFDIDIVYPLIGGWLPDFLEKNRKFVGKLSKIKGIFPENRTITELLVKKYALQNVHTLSNFRFVEYEPDVPSSNKDMFRIVFMSRIVKAKGIETVFKIAGYFSDPEVREKYPVSIDFYGERFEESDDYFEQMLARFDNVCYKGVLEPKEITRTLSAYDVLILPTRYPVKAFRARSSTPTWPDCLSWSRTGCMSRTACSMEKQGISSRSTNTRWKIMSDTSNISSRTKRNWTK